MNSVHALEQARERIRYGWCQGSDAQNVNGLAVDPWSLDAVQVCSIGAYKAVTFSHTVDPRVLKYLTRAIHNTGWCDDRPEWHVIADWNDAPERTKEDVVAVYTAAIELAKETA